MEILSLIFILASIFVGFAISKLIESRLDPKQYLWFTVGGSVLLMSLTLSLSSHLLIGVVMGCTLAYAIYQRYKAYVRYSTHSLDRDAENSHG